MDAESIHNLAKILYSDEGYLPYYPYHMISDEEMFDAFIFGNCCYFDDYYPLPDESLEESYSLLKSEIESQCTAYLEGDSDEIDSWVYSYMFGKVINPQSEQKDVHDLLVLLNLDNLYDEFNLPIYNSILSVSAKYIQSSTSSSNRPPTMYGEPHVIKYLRLEEVKV